MTTNSMTGGSDSQADVEKIACQLCIVKITAEKEQLRDHISKEHFYYARHNCQSCELTFTTREKASRHADDTGHAVVLNGVGSFCCGAGLLH